MLQTSTTSDLLRCPKNLKECIDWVICIETQKTDELAKALKSLVGTVELKTQLDPLASGLKKFLDGIKNNGSQIYSSSYEVSKAKWPECSQSRPCSGCLASSCPCSSPQSCHGSCCPNCDVQKAAKIFLGFLPSLYYALQYLYKRCNTRGWSDQKISDKDSSPGRFFVGMGFELGQLNQDKNGQKNSGLLKDLFPSPNGPLEKLYDVSKNYFTSSSSTSLLPSSKSQLKPPSTVREILLWLFGLPFTSGFEALLDHCESLCKTTGTSVEFNNFKASLFDSCFLPPFVLAAIEGSKSNEKGFPPYKSEWQNFSYPEDPFDLFEMLLENARKIFPPLAFLKYQCNVNKDSAGWKDCYYGQGCAEKFRQNYLQSSPSGSSCCSDSGPHGILCTSKPNFSNCHEHCINGKTCLGPKGSCDNPKAKGKSGAHTGPDDECKAGPCPHPLLAFICDSDPGKFKSLFKFPDGSYVTRMGFKNLPATAKSGESLLGILEPFCDSKNSSLTRLLQFVLCISRAPPENLGEFFSFFKMFVSQLTSNFADFENYVSKEPGGPSASGIKDALDNLYGSESSHWIGGKQRNGTHKNSSEFPANLWSLSLCHAPTSISTCGPYLNSLVDETYNILVNDFLGTYLSWICYRAEKFYSEFQKFHKEAQETFSSSCSHCRSCQNIVRCPCALPFIYSYGFTFMSPGGLACETPSGTEHAERNGVKEHKREPEKSPECTRKTCSQFLKRLRLVVNGQPFEALLRIIDEFIWSIRLPFVYAFLYIWILVISYFYYVQFYKLDLLHIDSHLHLPRSFKILPSTLFSDASSRLKDLSYFTL